MNKQHKILLKNGIIVTGNKNRDVFTGDLLIENEKITKISDSSLPASDAQVVDVSDQFVIPGFVQAHTHLCQTLFRGEADDLSLLEWLKKKIWPMEAAHDEDSLAASALYGCLEMQKNGTTSILDMGTVRHTQTLLKTVETTGMRYWGGKCLMDKKGSPLWERTKDALEETEELLNEWDGKNPLVSYALCPRFVVSCSEDLLNVVADLQKQFNSIVHVHASENLDEIKVVQKMTGMRNISYLNKLKLLNPKTAVIHAIHMNGAEIEQMAKTKTPMVHCPSSNLKLGSGIAPIGTYLKKKITIGLGGDGCACNNTMDPFKEMYLAALLQKPLYGPTALPAHQAFHMATMGGAKVLGVSDKIGSLEEGKFADVVTVDRSHLGVYTVADAYSALVYSCTGRDVLNVFIHGQPIIRNRVHQLLDEAEIKATALEQKEQILARI